MAENKDFEARMEMLAALHKQTLAGITHFMEEVPDISLWEILGMIEDIKMEVFMTTKNLMSYDDLDMAEQEDERD